MLAEYDHSGQLDDWEADVSGEPDQLDRYVLRALNCDLGNWAAKLVREKRREPQPDEYMERRLKHIPYRPRPTEETVETFVFWHEWPTLEMRFRFRMTDREIANATGVSVPTVRRRTDREMKNARETYAGEPLSNY
jgi:hypothetical protein